MKKLVLLLMLFGMSILMYGCSSMKLSDAFDKSTVKTTAQQVIEYLNNADFDSLYDMFGEDLQKALSTDDLSLAVEKTYGDAGAFAEYKSITIFGQKIKASGEDEAVAVIVAEYEKHNVTFTISFDTDMSVIGIYMK